MDFRGLIDDAVRAQNATQITPGGWHYIYAIEYTVTKN